MRTADQIVFEIEQTRALLKTAQRWSFNASKAAMISGTGHNNEALDLHTDIKSYKQSLAQLENELYDLQNM